jgi:hypothetical protein
MIMAKSIEARRRGATQDGDVDPRGIGEQDERRSASVRIVAPVGVSATMSRTAAPPVR